MARISDVAAHAGVSAATVSRVLNGKKVRADLTEAVWKSVEEMSYSRNRTARSLRRRSSDVVALIIPDIENPFFTSLARGVEDVCRSAGYSVVLCNTDDDPIREVTYLRIAADENMAGMIIAPADADVDLKPFIREGRGVVVLDRHVNADVDQVAFDNPRLGYEATTAMIKRGLQRIACITGPTRTDTARLRAEGWAQALDDAGLKRDEAWLHVATFHVDGGRRAAEVLLSETPAPDAIVATNNLLGVGVLQVLAERRMVGQIGVSVIGELPFATTSPEDVAVIDLDSRNLGVTAARMLMERIEGDTEPARSKTILDPTRRAD